METDDDGTCYQLVVNADLAGERIDKGLGTLLTDLSRVRIKALMAAGYVLIDGRPAMDPSRKLRQGQAVEVSVPPPVAATPQAQSIPLTVVFEDDYVIVIDKPAGLVVHPAPGNPDHTLVNALLAHCGDSLSGIGGERRPGIVHRLDKDTSGLMIAAKTDTAHRNLAEQFAVHSLTREYLALVWGRPKSTGGLIDTSIGRDPRNRKRMAVVSHGGKRAKTEWRLQQSVHADYSLIRCRLHTGRTHQVRVHLAHQGHPLVGDKLYGRKNLPKSINGALRDRFESLQRQALHSCLIGFLHPLTGAKLCFESNLPNDINKLINFST